MKSNIFFPHIDQYKEFQRKFRTIELFHEGLNELEKWSSSYFLFILQKKQLFTSPGDVHDLIDIKRYLNIQNKYDKLVKCLLDALTNHHYISEIQEDIYEIANVNFLSEEILEKHLETIIAKYPKIHTVARFLQKVMRSYLAVLTGEDHFIDVMFPSGNLSTIERIYKFNPDAEYFNKLVAHTAKLYARCESPISIIEIGSGVGATTEHVLSTLSKENLCRHYTYTDISKAFLRYGAECFEKDYSFLSFSTLDINKNPSEQGIENKYDIVVATNVIHATKNILDTLSHVKCLLKPNGILILNEGVEKKDFSTFAYGLADGWWAFTDDEWRISGSPFVNFPNWKKALTRSGFKKVVSLNELITPEVSFYQDVILAFC